MAGGGNLQDYSSLKREAKAASLPSWKSMDRLDNSSKCPDDTQLQENKCHFAVLNFKN